MSDPLIRPNDSTTPDEGFVLTRRQMTAPAPNEDNAAVIMIRHKLARIYDEAPDAKAEETKAAAAQTRSKHQQFIYDLQVSGRSLAEIHTAWHDYYQGLSDEEKHSVWREFYQAAPTPNTIQPLVQAPEPTANEPDTILPAAPRAPVVSSIRPTALSQAFLQSKKLASNGLHKVKQWQPPKALPMPKLSVVRSNASETASQIRDRLLSRVTSRGQLKLHHHLQSLSFGLAVGFLTLVIALFGLFNELIIVPFIQPGRTVGATPIIIDPSTVASSSTPEIIIPKISLEIPVDFTQTSNAEDVIQKALDSGVVHYPGTANVGENGNAALFGHSSNNIFNPGKYKFAFVLLHEVQVGDTFYLTKDGKTYIYKVFEHRVVDPSEVSVLDSVAGHTATATLITCDPPGTTLHRLVIVGDQISPSPNGNIATTAPAAATTVTKLPDNGPPIWQRVWQALFH